MLSLFAAFSSSSGLIPIALDDSYHVGTKLKLHETVDYLIQGYNKGAILVIAPPNISFGLSKRGIFESDYKPVTPKEEARENGYNTLKVDHATDSAFVLRINCTKGAECDYTIRNVHTEPVYRVSAVLGAFSLFICLFLLVFAWTLFCGACRAERKR